MNLPIARKNTHQISCVIEVNFTDFFNFNGSSGQESSDIFAVYVSVAEGP